MIRGEIWWANFGIPFGSEPGFNRPVVIIQNDDFTRSNINTIVVIPLTTNLNLEDAPGNAFIDKVDSSLPKDSVAVVSQLYAIDKQRMRERITKLSPEIIYKLEQGILLVLDIKQWKYQ